LPDPPLVEELEKLLYSSPVFVKGEGVIREKIVVPAASRLPGRVLSPGERRVNQDIQAKDVRLVGPEGEMIGVVSRLEALEKAQAVGLDLVEISPNAVPPVCKILNYGKFLYENQKRRSEAKKKQHVTEIKEVKLTPVIGEHDLQVKLASIRKFLEADNKVKLSLRFRGREMMHQEMGLNLLDRVRESLSPLAKVDQVPQLEGRSLSMILSSAHLKDKPSV
jgi:translation initiation factor IF-3